MSIIIIKEDSIPLKAYLRADPYSQHFRFGPDNSELVDDHMFWGDAGNAGLYLDYTKIKNMSVEIAEGISTNNIVQTVHDNDCADWIDNNFFKFGKSKLFVIQGYAGCGKTTFVNSLMHRGYSTNFSYIDIGKDWSYPQEPYMFFNETLSFFDELLDEISKKPNYNKIWDKFIDFGSEIFVKDLDLELPNIIPDFKRIKQKSGWKNLRQDLHEYLNNRYGAINNSAYYLGTHSIWHNVGQTQTIVSLLILLRCAETSIDDLDEPSFYTFAFDNLDVITDPSVPAENVVLFWGVIDRYNKFSEKYKSIKKKVLPCFKLIITVRKVLYSHITSHLPDLEMSLNLNPCYLNVCDISNMYQSKEVLTHRIFYWKKHGVGDDVIDKFDQLIKLMAIHNAENEDGGEESEEPLRSINLDAFFNHNYRAFSNILSALFESSEYRDILLPIINNNSNYDDWQIVATIMFLISYLYRKEKVWSVLGFGCYDFDTIDYPTTLNRLILNYLYLARCGHDLQKYKTDQSDLPNDNYVSLKDLLNTFNKIKVVRTKVNYSENQIDKQISQLNASDMEELVIDRLADMCARTPASIHSNAYGYDSEDEEHWRRPLYFTGGVRLNHTAASYDELKTYFQTSKTENTADQVLFAITDEGFILIRDIVACFEFYSGRYCRRKCFKPLVQVTSSDEVNEIISPVYNAISKCCIRSAIFRNEYMDKYNLSVDKYLKLDFHPRTRPRFSNRFGEKELSARSFRPQLHIVRVIYSHIAYFNKIKNYMSTSLIANNIEICRCLTDWIGKYLELYDKYFFETLDGTVCQSDNNVYNDLYTLLLEQMRQYEGTGQQQNISIET